MGLEMSTSGKRLSPTSMSASELFVEACKHGDVHTIQTMIGTSEVVHTLHSGFFTACKTGQVSVVELLLGRFDYMKAQLMAMQRFGAPVFPLSEVGCTALMVASMHGHVPVVNALVGNGAEVNAGNTRDQTALMCASLKGDLPVVEALVNHGADVKVRDKSGETALVRASEKGHVPVIDALVKHGSDVNNRDHFGETALMVASKNGHVPAVVALVDRGADVHIFDLDGQTALIWAIQKGHATVVEVLVKHGADVNVSDEFGKTGLMWASEGGQLSVVVALLSYEADVNIHDVCGLTALAWASENGHLSVVKTLVSHGADVNIQDEIGHTALIWASEKGHVPVINVLVSGGASVNIVTKQGQTALMWASKGGHVPAISALVKHGADVNIRDEDGRTALMWANPLDNVFEAIKVLLGHFASPLHVMNRGRQPAACGVTDLKAHLEIALGMTKTTPSSNSMDRSGPMRRRAGEKYPQIHSTVQSQTACRDPRQTFKDHDKRGKNAARSPCKDFDVDSGTSNRLSCLSVSTSPPFEMSNETDRSIMSRPDPEIFSAIHNTCSHPNQTVREGQGRPSTSKDIGSHWQNIVQASGDGFPEDPGTPNSENYLSERQNYGDKLVNSVLRTFLDQTKSGGPVNMTLNVIVQNAEHVAPAGNINVEKAKYVASAGDVNVESTENISPLGNINVENAEYVAQKGNVNVTTSQCIPGCERPEPSYSESETDDQPDLESVLDELTDTG